MRGAPPSRKAEGVDFQIGGDINIEMKLSNPDKNLQGLDSMERYGMYGPDCRSGGEDVTTYENKIRWLQLLKEFKPGRKMMIVVNITLGGPGDLGSARSNLIFSWGHVLCALRCGT